MKSKLLPLKDELIKAMKVAEHSAEAAEYLGDRFTDILVANKMEEQCKEMLAQVKDFVQYVKFKEAATAQPWSGEVASSTDFQNMQANIATDTSNKLQGIIAATDNLKLDLAINDNAELLRGYSGNGEAMDPETVVALDKLFNAWLAQQNLVTKNSTIYEVNDQGEIKTDAKGNARKANPERVKALIADRQQGLVSYLAKKGITMVAQQHPYPTPQVEQQKQEAVQAAVQAVQEQTAPSESIEPESPQTGIGSGA